jgi:hypothetical protein
VHKRDSKLVAKAMKLFLGAKDLNARTCALEGSKIFESTEKKVNFLLGSEFDSCHLDKATYSILCSNTNFIEGDSNLL